MQGSDVHCPTTGEAAERQIQLSLIGSRSDCIGDGIPATTKGKGGAGCGLFNPSSWPFSPLHSWSCLWSCSSSPSPTAQPTATFTPPPTATPIPTTTPMPTPTPEPTPTPPLNEADRAALITLFHATGGPDWTNNHKWLSDAPLGEWHGVTTDVGGRVVDLQLHDNGLTGELPPRLGELEGLTRLCLCSNDLIGEIPPEFGRPRRSDVP